MFLFVFFKHPEYWLEVPSMAGRCHNHRQCKCT